MGQVTLSSPLRISLFSPGMTSLHRAGTAGLWMTLKALDMDDTTPDWKRRTGGSWELGPTEVVLHWSGKAEPFFQALIAASFRLDKHGLVWFPALGPPTASSRAIQHALVLQGALLESFLQHGLSRKADSPQQPQGSLSIDVDGHITTASFRRIQSYKHQTARVDVERTSSAVVGWQFPGGAERHSALGRATALEEPLNRWLALLFAPVGCLYFETKSHFSSGFRPRYAIVIPDVLNLQEYAELRTLFAHAGTETFKVAGLSEAVLRVITGLESSRAGQRLGFDSCEVVAFAVLPWSSQQKTRLQVFRAMARPEMDYASFEVCRNLLHPRLRSRVKDGETWWDVPQVPELVARNLIRGRPWWNGFADFVADRGLRTHVFKYEADGLAGMVGESRIFSDGPGKVIVVACQQALRNHMGKKFARPGGARWESEFTKVRISISRCKTAIDLRETLTDFWARNGPLDALKGRWPEILPLLTGGWRESRDLALLALASYQPTQFDGSENRSKIEEEVGTET